MKARTVVLFALVCFVVLCGMLAVDAVRGKKAELPPLAAEVQPASPAAPVDVAPAVEPAAGLSAAQVMPELAAVNRDERTVTLGATYPDIRRTNDPERYKFKVELTSAGAAVKTAWLSEFDNRDLKALAPLPLLSPLDGGRAVYSLANTALRIAPYNATEFGTKAFPLDRLNWQLIASNADTATFRADLMDQNTAQPVLRLSKTYRVRPGSYDLTCELTVENLSGQPLQTMMELRGPVGLTREDIREDTRKIVVAYRKENAIETRLMTAVDIRHTEQEKIRPSSGFFTQLKSLFSKPVPPQVKLLLDADKGLPLVWAAKTNKYFAAILRPVGATLTESAPVRFLRATFYDTDLMQSEPAEHAGAGLLLATEPLALTAGGTQTLTFELYMGPKDKSIFEANEVYRKLGYFHTIDFRGCCCPSSLIGPLAFGIIWLMKSLYTLMGPLGNYGVVIIFLVFIVRLLLHPVTKHSQVSMMKMQKLGPKMQEIQKKYANNKQEMNRKMMELYREMGVSPVSGMLPMFLQMPIWIALWTAVYTSIDLRGQGFLPFWITDLSAPDHLFKLPFNLAIPYFGDYFNLLPILMGVVMYAQQKLMPSSQASAQANPQVAQQQKMMMIMMPLMFPLMLYHGPSGVNLYIMSSIGAGVIEQMVIRKHIRQREELEAMGTVPVTAKTGGKLKKKKPKPLFKFNKS